MNAGSEGAAAPAALTYPIAVPPGLGASVTIAPGLEWLRMRLPLSLNHINLWALADGTGWSVVDTGMRTAETEEAWESLFTGTLQSRPVARVICTHMHPDHVGMAGWLAQRFDCALWMTRLEYLTCRVLVADTGRAAPAAAVRFYHRAGWDEAALERYRVRFGGFGKMVHALPESYRRIVADEELCIGGVSWRVVIGRGHSPEHACLYSPELRVLISGDQVLPRISSNVSVFPTEPEADPLSDWLESLAAIRKTVPDEVLVLPAHNEPFRGLHARLGQLIDAHEELLARLYRKLNEPQRAIDVFAVLFGRRISAELLTMATGESLAHLNCLRRRGRAVCEIDAAGVAWYRSR